jgi:predicted kinase
VCAHVGAVCLPVLDCTIPSSAPSAGSGNQGRQRARQRHVERKAMRDNKPLAHIIVGFIGSGKTTFARKLEKETGAIRFTKDEWMVRIFGNTPPKDKFAEYDIRMASLATDMALKCLKSGISVIIDEGFWVKGHRDEIRKKVEDTGAIPILYYLEVPLEIMKARTLMRSENPPVDSYTIDEESFDHYWKFFRPPDKDEEFTLVNQASSL